MKYRKKPVVIEAFKYNYNANSETVAYPQWFMKAVLLGAISENDDNTVSIQTLEGKMRVNDGDWIIQGVAGEIYPCKPDIFETTYEEVDG